MGGWLGGWGGRGCVGGRFGGWIDGGSKRSSRGARKRGACVYNRNYRHPRHFDLLLDQGRGV